MKKGIFETEQILVPLRRMIYQEAYQFREKPFNLSNGGASHHYFDCKKVTMHPVGARRIGALVYQILVNRDTPIGFENWSGVGGLTLGADPLSAAIMNYAKFQGIDAFQLTVRKAQKKHGTSKWIEGSLSPPAKVLVVDDVVTTGASTITAIKRFQADGYEVVGALVLLDRQENDGMAKVAEALPGGEVVSLVQKQDILRLADTGGVVGKSPSAQYDLRF